MGDIGVSETPGRLSRVFETLRDHYGPMHWWPAGSAFEMAVGAVLTQNTAWRNVERAIANLRAASALRASVIHRLDKPTLETLLRPAGYFRLKSARVKFLAQWWMDHGAPEGVREIPTSVLRDSLLAVHGIGPETADCLLLYAFERPVFIADASARRLLLRLRLIAGDETYDAVRIPCARCFPGDVPVLNELHALIVTHGKRHCKKRASCVGCPLADCCPSVKGYEKHQTARSLSENREPTA